MSDKYSKLTVDFKQFIEEPNLLEPPAEKLKNPYYMYPRTVKEFDVENLNKGCPSKTETKEEKGKIKYDEDEDDYNSDYFYYEDN